MPQREPDEGLPVGIKPAPGKMRRPPENARIAARVARAVAAPAIEHVMPLNPGFFALERMRAGAAVKARAKVRAKVSGK